MVQEEAASPIQIQRHAQQKSQIKAQGTQRLAHQTKPQTVQTKRQPQKTVQAEAPLQKIQ